MTFSSYPGTYVLTGSADRAIHLSRAIPNNSSTTGHETTSPIQKYEAHGYSVLDVAVAADNARFTSVGGDRQVFLWDVEQGITTQRWTGHNARVEAVQFAGEGDSVVVSGEYPLEPFLSIAVVEQSAILTFLAGSADTTINLWDTRSKSHKPIQTLTEAGDTVSSLHVHMPTYSIASGSYDGRARIYDVRMGRTTVDVLAHPVTSVRCSADGNALLVSTLDSRIRMLDQADGKLLKAFGGEEGLELGPTGARVAYRNSELRIRSVFAKGDAVVLSGSESDKGDPSPQAHVFAWDVLSGEIIATVPAGGGVKVVSCVAWNEKGGCWAGGCSDGMSNHVNLCTCMHRLLIMVLCRQRQNLRLNEKRIRIVVANQGAPCDIDCSFVNSCLPAGTTQGYLPYLACILKQKVLQWPAIRTDTDPPKPFSKSTRFNRWPPTKIN